MGLSGSIIVQWDNQLDNVELGQNFHEILLEMIRSFSNVTIQSQHPNPVVFLYINNKHAEVEILETLLIHNSFQTMGINLTNEVKDLYD